MRERINTMQADMKEVLQSRLAVQAEFEGIQRQKGEYRRGASPHRTKTKVFFEGRSVSLSLSLLPPLLPSPLSKGRSYPTTTPPMYCGDRLVVVGQWGVGRY